MLRSDCLTLTTNCPPDSVRWAVYKVLPLALFINRPSTAVDDDDLYHSIETDSSEPAGYYMGCVVDDRSNTTNSVLCLNIRVDCGH